MGKMDKNGGKVVAVHPVGTQNQSEAHPQT